MGLKSRGRGRNCDSLHLEHCFENRSGRQQGKKGTGASTGLLSTLTARACELVKTAQTEARPVVFEKPDRPAAGLTGRSPSHGK
jgi:hypothetical protein